MTEYEKELFGEQRYDLLAATVADLAAQAAATQRDVAAMKAAESARRMPKPFEVRPMPPITPPPVSDGAIEAGEREFEISLPAGSLVVDGGVVAVAGPEYGRFVLSEGSVWCVVANGEGGTSAEVSASAEEPERRAGEFARFEVARVCDGRVEQLVCGTVVIAGASADGGQRGGIFAYDPQSGLYHRLLVVDDGHGGKTVGFESEGTQA